MEDCKAGGQGRDCRTPDQDPRTAREATRTGNQKNPRAELTPGRYLDNPLADDVFFGNVFEYPIRDSLPWGTSIATKFMT